MLEELSNDFSKYLKVDLNTEVCDECDLTLENCIRITKLCVCFFFPPQLHDVQDTIDDMLTRLDEFENLLNMVIINFY